MNLYALPPLISGVIIFLVGLFGLTADKKNTPKTLFSLCCLTLAAWFLSYSLICLNDANPLMALRWARIGFFGISFFPVLAYHFTNSFLGRVPAKWTLPLLYSLAFLATFLNQTDLIYRGVNHYYWGYYPAAGELYPLFLVMFAALFGASVILLFLAWQKARRAGEGAAGQKIFYLLVAFIGGSTGLADFIPSFLPGSYPFGYLSALFFTAVIAYTLLQRHLTAIESVIKRTAVYSLLTASITALLALLILLNQRSFDTLFGFSPLWTSFIGAFIIALFFKPFHDRAQDFVDYLFFRARYNYQSILKKYIRALAQPSKDLDRFVKLAPYLLLKALKLDSAACLIFDRPNNRYVVGGATGDKPQTNGQALPATSPLIRELTAKKLTMSREEFVHRLKRSETPNEQDRALHQAMIELKAEVIIPCVSESEYFKEPTLLTGLVLGHKLSGESFSRDDLDFLKELIDQVALSIEYTFMFQELKSQSHS